MRFQLIRCLSMSGDKLLRKSYRNRTNLLKSKLLERFGRFPIIIFAVIERATLTLTFCVLNSESLLHISNCKYLLTSVPLVLRYINHRVEIMTFDKRFFYSMTPDNFWKSIFAI